MASNEEKSDGIGETIKTVVYALLIAGIFRSFFFQPFYIPTGSMKDTLLVGDFMFVNKMAYGYSKYSCPFGICPFPESRLFGAEPARGDVVVFRHPTSGQDYIKRLIGLPGDSVQMKNGVLFLNGEEQVQTPAGEFIEPYAPQGSVGSRPGCENGAVGEGGECVKSRYREDLKDHGPHNVLNIFDQTAQAGRINGDNTPVYRVPEGHYFFMGDNRDNSVDSRFPQGASGGVGMVPYENLLGRADRVIFSSAGSRMLFFWTWRGDRFFEAIE